MISGIHLATALSVMLHMEKEGNGMDKMSKTDDLAECLRKADYDTPYVWDLTAEAADLLSEQQQVIDELVGAIEGMLALSVTGKASNAARKLLSRAKGHTGGAE